MARRKYDFATRAEYHEAFKERDRQLTVAQRILASRFVSEVPAFRCTLGDYTLDVWERRCGHDAQWTFHAKGNGGPSVMVFDFEEWLNMWEMHFRTLGHPVCDDTLAIRDIYYKAREYYNKWVSGKA